MTNTLQSWFVAAAQREVTRTALVEPGVGRLSYAELDALSDAVRDRLLAWGLQPGDRVGICLPKSANSVALILGTLKSGCAYVPVDVTAPAARSAYILHNCRVSALFVDEAAQPALLAELAGLGAVDGSTGAAGSTGPAPSPAAPRCLAVSAARAEGAGAGLRQALDRLGSAPATATVHSAADDLAYILYTSGSTGQPKGVMLSQRAATSFVDWCSATFAPRADDRFSSHAPFHFDLSVLDLYLCFKHGATLVLIGDDLGKDARRLAALVAEERISIWYSAPSILALLAQFGQLEAHDHGALRLVLFAGEVFAVKHLRSLCRQWPGKRYFNLYGPTETNVCTAHEVVLPVPGDRSEPYPIGAVCSHLQAQVLDEQGQPVEHGAPGELCIAGPGVMQGYWALPERSAAAFHVDADGLRWYRTGDVVTEGAHGEYSYRGRRDRMVKRRGYRIELGEIEAALYRHAAVKEAAAIALTDDAASVSIVACVAWSGSRRPSLIEMKRFCAENLPLSMVPDRFSWHESLPKTSTDKIDYQRLKDLV